MTEQQMELDTAASVDPDCIEHRVPCIKIKQPIGDIYVASMPASLITQISYFDVRRIERENREVESYLGIQRPINKQRIKDLHQYVNFVDATFPTSIILSIGDEHCEYDIKKREIIIRNYRSGEDQPSARIRDIAKVLDGQHRIEGLQRFAGDVFEVPVSIFIGADIADQAYIFSIVNLEQSKVSKNLAYDLYALARSRSPQRTCHNIAIALDRDAKSPFFRRIKRLGTTTPGRTFEPISQSTFVEGVMGYISENPKKDRDDLLRGKNLNTNPSINHRYVLRQMFIDERDIDIGICVDNYFSAFKEQWPTAWNNEGQGAVLNRTNGFRALMRLFWNVYIYLGKPGEVHSKEKVLNLLKKVPANDDFFMTENFPPGSAGEAKMYNYFLSHLDFLPQK